MQGLGARVWRLWVGDKIAPIAAKAVRDHIPPHQRTSFETPDHSLQPLTESLK
jgi:hypothetical protein